MNQLALLQHARFSATTSAEFDALIEKPKLPDAKKTGIVVGIVFDIDEKIIYLNANSLDTYITAQDLGRSEYKYFYFKTGLWGSRGKPFVVCAPFDKVETMMAKSLLGVEGDATSQIIASITQKTQATFHETAFYKALEQIATLRDAAGMLTSEALKKTLKLASNDVIVLAFAEIVSSSSGYAEPKKLSELEGFQDCVRAMFQPKTTSESSAEESLCYITGEMRSDVKLPKFNDRKSLNYVFVNTTKNYASNFDDKNYPKNYQASEKIVQQMEIASSWHLEHLRTRIAGVPHVILPQFPSYTNPGLEYLQKNIDRSKELLFSQRNNTTDFEQLTLDVQDVALDQEEDRELYWLHFIGYQSDGQSFKILNHVQDVPNFRVQLLIATCRNVSKWLNIVSSPAAHFNLYALYRLIPVNTDAPQNEALEILSAILEGRPLSPQYFYERCCKLLSIHRSPLQYAAYPNVEQFSTAFDFAAHHTVMGYAAIMQFLTTLHLIPEGFAMDTTAVEALEPKRNNQDLTPKERGEEFEKRMNASLEGLVQDKHRAFFYVGRMLDVVASAQYAQGHTNKPILNKMNFTGMNLAQIRTLIGELWEKAQQYSRIKDSAERMRIVTDKAKSALVCLESTPFTPQEAVMYIMMGYSFGASGRKKSADSASNSSDSAK